MRQIHNGLNRAFEELQTHLIKQQGEYDRHNQSENNLPDRDDQRIDEDLLGIRQLKHIREIVETCPCGTEYSFAGMNF